MAKLTFPIVKYKTYKPLVVNTNLLYGTNFGVYNQIICEGPNGEVLLLTYIRPDSPWQNDPIDLNQVRHNTCDLAEKRGLVFFQSGKFSWHLKMLKSGKQVQAELDSTYPWAQRIFMPTIMQAPTHAQAPNVIDWLGHHANIQSALTWPQGDNAVAFEQWDDQKKQDLTQAFEAAWNHQPMLLNDPPPNIGDFDADHGVILSVDNAWKLFCAHAAYSLAVEIANRVPWSITNYPADALARLFSGGRLFRWDEGLQGYRLMTGSLPAPPELVWGFLTTNDLLGPDRVATIANMLDWCRHNLAHFNGSTEKENMIAHWGYPGYPPASRVIEGTISSVSPDYGVLHYTAGCWGTSDFLSGVLRVINIPVERARAGPHATPHFLIDDLFLSHGDDPYTKAAKCTPPYDARLLLIDRATYDQWFNPQLPEEQAALMVGHRPAQLNVQYLSDVTMHNYYLDMQHGLTPQEGTVYRNLQIDYPNFEDLFPSLWERMDQKFKTLARLSAPIYQGPRVKTPPQYQVCIAKDIPVFQAKPQPKLAVSDQPRSRINPPAPLTQKRKLEKP